jgi:hypothetical protein
VTNVDGAMADWLSQGFKAAYATRIDKVIGEGTGADRNGLLGNNKGLDHFSESPISAALVATVIKRGGDPALLN